ERALKVASGKLFIAALQFPAHHSGEVLAQALRIDIEGEAAILEEIGAAGACGRVHDCPPPAAYCPAGTHACTTSTPCSMDDRGPSVMRVNRDQKSSPP